MTQDKLIDLCRYDIGWIEVVGGSDIDAYPESGFDVQCENEYPMLLSDLKTALSHFEDEKLSFEDFAFDWWCPITTYFYEDLCLDELLGPDPDNIYDLPLPPLPETDEDMIVTVFLKIAKIADTFDENGGMPKGTASEVLGLANLINMIDNFEENKELPPEERTYTKDQMIKKLEKLGFKRWQKGGFDRLYIDASRLGLVCDYYKTGNICRAEFNGERISNSEGYRMKAAKTYIDVDTWTVHSTRRDLEEAAKKLANIA